MKGNVMDYINYSEQEYYLSKYGIILFVPSVSCGPLC